MDDRIQQLTAAVAQDELTPQELRDAMLAAYEVISRLNQTQGNPQVGLRQEPEQLAQHLRGFMQAVFWERGYDFDQPTPDQLSEVKLMMDGMAQIYSMPEGFQNALNDLYDSLMARAKGFPAALSPATKALLHPSGAKMSAEESPAHPEFPADALHAFDLPPSPLDAPAGSPASLAEPEAIQETEPEPDASAPEIQAAAEPESVVPRADDAPWSMNLPPEPSFPPATFPETGAAEPEDAPDQEPPISATWAAEEIDPVADLEPQAKTTAEASAGAATPESAPPADSFAWDLPPAPTAPDTISYEPSAQEVTAALPPEPVDPSEESTPPELQADTASPILAFPKKKRGRKPKAVTALAPATAGGEEPGQPKRRGRKKSTEPKVPRPPRQRSHKKQALKIDLSSIHVPDDFMVEEENEAEARMSPQPTIPVEASPSVDLAPAQPLNAESWPPEPQAVTPQSEPEPVWRPEATALTPPEYEPEPESEPEPELKTGSVSELEPEETLPVEEESVSIANVPAEEHESSEEMDWSSLQLDTSMPAEWNLGSVPGSTSDIPVSSPDGDLPEVKDSKVDDADLDLLRAFDRNGAQDADTAAELREPGPAIDSVAGKSFRHRDVEVSESVSEPATAASDEDLFGALPERADPAAQTGASASSAPDAEEPFGGPFPKPKPIKVVLPEELEPPQSAQAPKGGIWVGVLLMVLGLGIGAGAAYYWFGLKAASQAEKRVAAMQEKVDSLQQELATSVKDVSDLKAVITRQTLSARQPVDDVQYIKIGSGVLLYWFDASEIARNYVVHRAKGTTGKFAKLNDRPMRKNLIWIKKVSRGTWRYAVTAVNPDGGETEKSKILTLKFPLR